MPNFYLMAGATVVAIAVLMKLFESRIPAQLYRVGIVIYVTLPFVALAVALTTEAITWTALVLFITFALITGIGTGVGYHRLLTHFSFETRPSIRLALIGMGAMASATAPVSFATTHLKHHAHADDDDDPHSPIHGLFHAHIGWIFKRANSPEDRERYCGRLLTDRVVMFVDKSSPAWFILGFVIPYLIGGWEGLLWGGFIRYGYHNHAAFSVNSICHTFGDRPFNTKDDSRNNWLIGLIAFGEGWHNNHHAFPAMAYHGIGWRQFDLNGLVIRGLAAIGLAWKVKQPSPELIERRKQSLQPSSASAD